MWTRLKWHFTESFAGGLLQQRRATDGERIDELRDTRRRHAYRYILLLLAVVMLPVVAHNIYVRQLVPAIGAIVMLGMVIVNILLLSANRDAFLPAPVMLLISIALLMLSLYYGQDYNLFLLFPMLVAIPIIFSFRWAVFLGVMNALLAVPLVLNHYDGTTSAAIGISMMLTWLVSAWMVFAMTEQSRRLKGMAITDSLTGAFNRRYLELQAGRCLNDWHRFQRAASLLLLDIDHFKYINDRFGHTVGDEALTRLVALLQNRLRKADIVCRFGGEEFAVLLSETSFGRANYVAEEIRAVVESANILPAGNMTISIGVCDLTQVKDLEHWFKLADAALYRAKRNGRNCVELATVPTDSSPTAFPSNVPLWR